MVSLNPRAWLKAAAGSNMLTRGLNMPVGTAAKNIGIATAVVGTVAGLLTYEAITRKDKRQFRADEAPVTPLPPLLTPQDLMMQPMPEMAAGPVDGYGEYQWRNSVNASRGQQLEQPAVKAAQPRMSAIDPDGVRELGSKIPTV